jgi:hypothetical protein
VGDYKNRTEKDMDGKVLGLLLVLIPEFAWRSRRKL